MHSPVVSPNGDSPEVSLFSEDYSIQGLDISAAAISPDTPKLLFTRKECAYSLGLSLRSVAFLLKSGQLGFKNYGSKILIPHQELVKFSKKDHYFTAEDGSK